MKVAVPRRCLEQRRNTGVLHSVQDDDFKRKELCTSILDSLGFALKAPAETAVAAGGSRGASEKALAEALIVGAVPYLAEARLRGVAEGEAAVALHAERRDAAGQNAAVGGDVHQRPGAAAERPGTVVELHLTGLAGVDGAGGREHDA